MNPVPPDAKLCARMDEERRAAEAFEREVEAERLRIEEARERVRLAREGDGSDRT